MFDVAHFWHIDPAVLMNLSAYEFDRYEAQAERIARQQQPT